MATPQTPHSPPPSLRVARVSLHFMGAAFLWTNESVWCAETESDLIRVYATYNMARARSAVPWPNESNTKERSCPVAGYVLDPRCLMLPRSLCGPSGTERIDFFMNTQKRTKNKKKHKQK